MTMSFDQKVTKLLLFMYIYFFFDFAFLFSSKYSRGAGKVYVVVKFLKRLAEGLLILLETTIRKVSSVHRNAP